MPDRSPIVRERRGIAYDLAEHSVNAICNRIILGNNIHSSDLNNNWMCKDKDQAYKTRTIDFEVQGPLTTVYKDLQLNLQLQSSNDNEHAQQTTVVQD